MNLQKQIEEALEKDVDLTDEEYRLKDEKADTVTKAHGQDTKAPISEAKRFKRIQRNFFGLSINYLACILSALDNSNTLLTQQNAMLYELCKKENINVAELFRTE